MSQCKTQKTTLRQFNPWFFLSVLPTSAPAFFGRLLLCLLPIFSLQYFCFLSHLRGENKRIKCQELSHFAMWDFCDLSLLPDSHSAQPSSCVLSLALSTRPLLILHRLQTQSLLLFFLSKASLIVQFTERVLLWPWVAKVQHLVFHHSWFALTHSAAF